MADNKKIKTALISVFHKDGLEALLKKLNDEGVKFLSTGGTLSSATRTIPRRARRSIFSSSPYGDS